MNETEKQRYQKDYFTRVTLPKRRAAAKKKRDAREAAEFEQARQRGLLEREEARAQNDSQNDSQALAIAHARRIEREQRNAAIAGEFPDLAPDEILEDGSNYYTHLFQWVEEYLTDTRIALAHYDFGAFYNMLSMEAAGQALLRYTGIEPLAGADWQNFTFANRGDGKGCFKTLVNPPENIAEVEEKWKARWAKEGRA
jgi:hypothetical protein